MGGYAIRQGISPPSGFADANLPRVRSQFALSRPSGTPGGSHSSSSEDIRALRPISIRSLRRPLVTLENTSAGLRGASQRFASTFLSTALRSERPEFVRGVPSLPTGERLHTRFCTRPLWRHTSRRLQGVVLTASSCDPTGQRSQDTDMMDRRPSDSLQLSRFSCAPSGIVPSPSMPHSSRFCRY